jgi:fatty acid-binding protein DegV
LTRQSVGSKPVVKAAVIHVNNPVGAQELQVLLRETVPCPEQIITAQFTPGLSIHAGTGVVGVVLLTAK